MGGVVGGLFGGDDAAEEAGQIQAQASEEGQRIAKEQYLQTRGDLAPYLSAGNPALQQYMALLGLGGGGGGGQFAGAPQLTEDQIRQNLIASGQFSTPGKPDLGIYQKGGTIYIPESLKGTGGYRDYDYLSSQQYDRVTGGDEEIEYYEGGGTAGSLDEDALNKAIQEQLAGQNQFSGGGISQQDAINSIYESPGQQFIRSRAQKNLLRNAAAVGGIGGGNVRTALVEQGAGFAAQDLQNQFARLQNLIGGGQNAATNLGQFGQTYAQTAAGLGQGAAQARASGILGAQQARSDGAGNALGLVGAGLGAFAPAGSFLAKAGGALSFFSDERLKENVRDLDLKACFDAVMEMPLKSWSYLESAGLDTGAHIGPMAQDAPDMIRDGEVDGYQVINLHDELMMIAGALQYMKNNDMIKVH